MKRLPWKKEYVVISFHIFVTAILIYLSIKLFESSDKIMAKTGVAMKAAMPLFIAVLFAYFFEPLIKILGLKLQEFFTKDTKKELTKSYRVISTFIVYILFILILAGIIALFVLSITGTVNKLNVDIIQRGIVKFYNESLQQILSIISSWGFDTSTITRILGNSSSSINLVGQKLINLVVGLGNFVIVFFIAWTIGIYISIDKDYFINGFKKTSKTILDDKLYNFLSKIFIDIEKVFLGFIRGQVIDAFIMVIIISVSLSIIRVPNAVVIGTFAGISNLIPFFGPIVGVALSTIFSLTSGSIFKAVLALIIMIVIQQIDGNIIAPRVMGKFVNIHPVTIIISIIVGGALYGIPGMFFSIPIVGLIKLFFIRWERRKLHYNQ